MLSKDKRICPCCGKTLKPIPPDRYGYPKCVGLSANGVEFCIINSSRLMSYTRKPRSGIGGNENILNFYSAVVLDRHCDKVYKGSKYHSSMRPSESLRRKIERGGLSLYDPNIRLLCGNCENLVALDKNPCRSLGVSETLFAFISFVFMILLVLAVAEVLPWTTLGITALAGIIAAAVFFPIVLFLIRFIEKRFNNIVPIDEYDNLIYPPTEIKLNTSIRSPYLREGNVLTVKLDDGEVHIYLVHKADNCEFSICCEDDEREQIKQRLSECAELELTFEGKRVGTAEILEVIL
ncbi:MAG: hypothetical protein K2N38_10220 [Oscillospiraceae bacterium]|nr:hypothetical protein [Oscillospiraceae bacterium]